MKTGKRATHVKPSLASRLESKLGDGWFMKTTLILCFIEINLYTIWQQIIFTITGNEAATLTQWFFTLWGIEVGLMCFKKIAESGAFGKKHKKKKQADHDETACG